MIFKVGTDITPVQWNIIFYNRTWGNSAQDLCWITQQWSTYYSPNLHVTLHGCCENRQFFQQLCTATEFACCEYSINYIKPKMATFVLKKGISNFKWQFIGITRYRKISLHREPQERKILNFIPVSSWTRRRNLFRKKSFKDTSAKFINTACQILWIFGHA